MVALRDAAELFDTDTGNNWRGVRQEAYYAGNMGACFFFDKF